MMANVKYPVRAALAGFIPMRDLLCMVEAHLMDAGLDNKFYPKIVEIRRRLIELQAEIEPLEEQ
jgi:hypothetical protein